MESTQDAINTISDLNALHQKNISLIENNGKGSKKAVEMLRYLEQHPITDIKKASEDLGISFNTAASTIRKFVELGILEQTAGMQRNRVFAYQHYLDILRRDTEVFRNFD